MFCPQQHLSQLGHVLLAVDRLRGRTHHVTRSTQLHVDPQHIKTTRRIFIYNTQGVRKILKEMYNWQ